MSRYPQPPFPPETEDVREIRHRHHNQLALISSLLRMERQAASTSEASQCLQSMETRIQAIIALNRCLSEKPPMPAGKSPSPKPLLFRYLSRITELHQRIYPDKRFRLQQDPSGGTSRRESAASCGESAAFRREWSARNTSALGLVFTEIMTNAVKHSPPAAEISITAAILSPNPPSQPHPTFILSQTNPIRTSPLREDPGGPSLGRQLLEGMTSELGGSLQSETLPPPPGSPEDARPLWQTELTLPIR